MATNPDPNFNPKPRRMPDPELGPVKKGGPFPWGLVGVVLTILALAAIIWYFR